MANEVVALILWLIASFFIIFASCDHGPQVAYIIAGVSVKFEIKIHLFIISKCLSIDSRLSCNDCLFVFFENIIQLVSKWNINSFGIIISYSKNIIQY